jgi:thioesterase domain-containing protein/acyl carrier protein
VAVSHSAAVNLAFARRTCHDPLGAGDRVLAAISVGFDVSIGQLLLPLLSGAAVMIAGDVKTMGASEFWALLADRRVTHINSVPSFFDSILEAAPKTSELNLKRLMLGGEALSGALVARIQRSLPGVEVVNMYGPTEACIDATYHVAKSEDVSASVLPIGRPLSNYRAYVLDSRMEPVGIGVTGELYLGGAGLARGYVNAPDLTAERFPSDPFSITKGARLYRTGDRVRWRADGCLEFLGRADQQVKIRGFRVEPGEIEAQLRKLPGVREAAVVSQNSGNGTRLIAYFTGEEALDVKVLRAGLAAVLPDHMVPAAFVKLDRLPLSANGKLDRKSLPEPEQSALVSRSSEAPQGEVEQKMAALWTELLTIERVGRDDNFFELGGDSLGAMRLVNSLNTAFHVNLPIRSLFEHPTLKAMSGAVRSDSSVLRDRYLVHLQPGGSKQKLFCIHPAGGHIFCYRSLVQELGPDQPVFGLQAAGLETGESLASSIQQMASDYVRAIRKVQPEGPYQLLGMSSGGLIAYEMARQIKDSGSEVRFLALLDTTVPGSQSETMFSEQMLVHAMAGELGCGDLMNEAPPTLTLQQLVDLAHHAGRLPPDFRLAQAERIANVFRNMVRMHFGYRPQHWDGPMLLLRALRRFRDGDFAPDWSPYVTDALEIVDLDCEHSDLVSPALSPTVAALIARRLR